MLINDIKRFLRSPKIYLAFAISFMVLVRPLWGTYSQKASGTVAQFLSVPFGMSDFSPFAALFCVFPFADSFCEDYNSGIIQSVVVRVGPKKYSSQRGLSVALSGGLLMSSVVLAVILICVFLADQPETVASSQFMYKSIWARMDLVLRYHGFFFLSFKVLIAFLFGCLWGLVGLAISVFITNRYVTYIAPFVLYQICWFLLEGSAFNPVYMLRGDAEFIPSLGFLFCYQILLIIICYSLSIVGIQKKVSL